jgi:diphosphate--fructose-6-phosphate 1-phosphotransferase
LRTEEELAKTVETCKKLELTGLVLVGATHTLTDGVYLSEHFLKIKLSTRVIVVPASVDGNIHHKYIQAAIGFDTCSKLYSQLIGNMLTDSASAIKYWYFIRLMGNKPSHMALECALKTCPNMVIISEECVDRKETLWDIVDNICEVIIDRAKDHKNYGAILIPEGLLSQLASFDQMIIEMNKYFMQAHDKKELAQMVNNLEKEAHLKDVLSPWSYSLFISLPDFFRHQMLVEREIAGSLKLS